MEVIRSSQLVTIGVSIGVPIPGEAIEATPTEVYIGGPMGGPIGGPISLTERQEELIKLIRANPTISRRRLAKELNINPSAVTKHLDALKDKGVLRRIGGTRGHWDVSDGQ